MKPNLIGAGALLCFLGSGLAGLIGFASLLAEGPDPETGHIVGSRSGPYIFFIGAAIAIGLASLGIKLLKRAQR